MPCLLQFSCLQCAEGTEKLILRNEHEASFRFRRRAASTFSIIITYISQKASFSSDIHSRMLTKQAPFSGLKNPYSLQPFLRVLNVF